MIRRFRATKEINKELTASKPPHNIMISRYTPKYSHGFEKYHSAINILFVIKVCCATSFGFTAGRYNALTAKLNM